MVTRDTPNDTATLAEATAAELAVLREKVEALLDERVRPAVNGIADRASETAAEVRTALRAEADGVATRVREQPFVALGAAAAIGLAIGVLLRR